MYELVGNFGTDFIHDGLSKLALTYPRSGQPGEYELADGRFNPIERDFKPYLDNLFPGPWRFAFVVVLGPGAVIRPHVDKDEGTRYHLVLSTNDACWSMNDGRWLQCELGGIYTMNPRLTHASANWGVTPRVHLVIDTETFIVR